MTLLNFGNLLQCISNISQGNIDGDMLTLYFTHHNIIFVCLIQSRQRSEVGELVYVVITPQPLMAVGALFSPMVSRWAGGRLEKVCPCSISETVRCRKLIRGRDIG